jgi:hypothetical protein
MAKGKHRREPSEVPREPSNKRRACREYFGWAVRLVAAEGIRELIDRCWP